MNKLVLRFTLILHSVIEILAGINFLFNSKDIIPVDVVREDLSLLIKCFGVALIAFGFTTIIFAFSSNKSMVKVLFGALVYHISISSLFFYQQSHANVYDPTFPSIKDFLSHGSLFHAIFAVFVFAVISGYLLTSPPVQTKPSPKVIPKLVETRKRK